MSRHAKHTNCGHSLNRWNFISNWLKIELSEKIFKHQLSENGAKNGYTTCAIVQ